MREHERSRDKDRQHARAMWGGLGMSLLLHVLIVVFFAGESMPVSPFAAAGERRGSDRAAAGGGMEAIQLATPRSEVPVPPPPVPVPAREQEAVEPPEPEVMLEDVPAIALAQALATPGEPGPRVGPGLLDATGEGDGGTEEEGLFRVVPPKPRGMILPPGDRPSSVRGREVEVWVYVTAAGRVAPDSTRLQPPTGDRGFDRRLREHASGWVFEAARRDGRPVGEWFSYTIVM